jgi:hypothetical protein
MTLMANLRWADGQVNPSGIKTKLFLALKSEIVTHPKVVAAPATPAENVELAGDYEMAAGKTFIDIYSTQGKGKAWWESTGEKDHKMFLNKGSFKYPDISDEAKSMAKQLLNSNVVAVFLLPTGSGIPRAVVIGEEDFDTTVTNNGDSGDAPGTEKGLFFELEAPSFNPLPTYKGAIELPDGSYDCETGVFTPTIP